jgi:hypothetical protein
MNRRLSPAPGQDLYWCPERGFDWLGYQFDASELVGVAARALDNHRNTLRRLYEQARRLRLSQEQTRRRVVEYQGRWLTWLTAGLRSIVRLPRHNVGDQASPCDTRML